MTDGKGTIHDFVKGVGSDSDHMVITLQPLSNTEEKNTAEILMISNLSSLSNIQNHYYF